MESPENVWQFSRAATDAQGSSSFLVPTQYDDYCGQPSNFQMQEKSHETMQRSKTQSSSVNDVDSQSLQGAMMLHSLEGHNIEYDTLHSVESFSTMATVQDQTLPQQSAAATSPTDKKSEGYIGAEEDLSPQMIDAQQSPKEPAHAESLNTPSAGIISPHALPGLVSFEPLVAYIDPRSQTIPYNNSATPSYQNSFYYQCMPPPPPIIYPAPFPTYINHQAITMASKTDAFHLQPVPVHQQDSRARPRHFWSEDDAYRARQEFEIYHGQPLMDNYTYMPHKNDRFDAHSLLSSKSNVPVSDRGPGSSRKRQKPTLDGSYEHGERHSLARDPHARKTSATNHTRKAKMSNLLSSGRMPESSPCARVGLATHETVEPVTPQSRNVIEAPTYLAQKLRSDGADHESMLSVLQPPEASEDILLQRFSASNVGFGGTSQDNEQQNVAIVAHPLTDPAQEMHHVGTFAGIIKDEIEDSSIIKHEDVPFHGLPASAQSSLTTGAIGVVEWQKECHKFDKESKTKIVMHDTTNQRDCSPRRSRRVSYNYSDSELSPVPSASLGTESIDRDDAESRVKEAASTKWTEDDNARLVRLRASGSTWPALANALGRSKRACQLKYVQLTKQAPYFFLGHPKKLEHLMRLYEERKEALWTDIALELGCLPRVAEEKVFELMRER